MNANSEAPADEAALFSRLGLLKDDHRHVAAQDMIDAGLNPLDTSEQANIAELQKYLPGTPPSLINGPSSDPAKDEKPEYDFSSIQMVTDNRDASEIVPIDIPECTK